VDSKSLIAKIPIVAENYMQDAANQPALFMEAARYRVAAMRGVAQADANVEAAESRLALKIRNRRDEDGKKPTEGAVKDALNGSPRIRAARDARDKAHALEELSKLILEGFRHRRDALRIIADSQHIEGLKAGHEVDRMLDRNQARLTAQRAEASRRRLAVDE
jgi:hypothetical protein